MSLKRLIEIVERLYQLHSSLYEIAVKKTEVIKQGDIESLNGFMKEEWKHVQAIKQLEEVRKNAAKEICPEKEMPTIADCLERLTGTEHKRLLAAADKLTVKLSAIKEQNALNQQMLHNSLKFVQYSLNLLRPQQESFNYAPPSKKQPDIPSTGMFNSKA